MSKADFFGHFFYFFLFVGMLLLQAKDYRGWAFRFAGEIGWIGIGLILGMSSIWAWGFAFMVVDVLGYFKWQKEQEELAAEETKEQEELHAYVKNYIKAQQPVDDIWSDDFGPECSGNEHVEGCREFQKRPLPPAILVGALQDVVHKESGKTRPAKSIKVKSNGKNKTSQRKAEGKKIPARNRKTVNRKVRAGRR